MRTYKIRCHHGGDVYCVNGGLFIHTGYVYKGRRQIVLSMADPTPIAFSGKVIGGTYDSPERAARAAELLFDHLEEFGEVEVDSLLAEHDLTPEDDVFSAESIAKEEAEEEANGERHAAPKQAVRRHDFDWLVVAMQALCITIVVFFLTLFAIKMGWL